jgi:protein-tyrosine phosphatase
VGWPLGLEQQLFELRLARLTPIIAHPERNREVQADPERLEPLVETGTLLQITAASLDGRLGRSSQTTAARLLELGFVHLLASDAHTPEIREAGLAAAAESVGDAGLARYLTEDAPAAIVAGEGLPELVRRPPRRRRFGLF